VWKKARDIMLISSFLLLAVVSYMAELLAVIIKIILVIISVFIFLYSEELVKLYQILINCRSRHDY
jgi:hypothetical protein